MMMPPKTNGATPLSGYSATLTPPTTATETPRTGMSGGSADPPKTVHSSAVTDKDDLDPPDPKRRILAVPLPFQSVPISEQQFENDDTVAAVVEIFTDVLLGGGWKWEGDSAEECKPLTDAIERAVGWNQLLDGLSKQFARRLVAFEMVWDTTDAWVPSKFRELPSGRNGTTFVDLDELQDIVTLRVTTSAGLQEVPLTNAIIARYRPTFADPLGQTKYAQAKEIVGFKRRADANLARYIDRLAGILVGWYQMGMSDEDQGKFLSALKQMFTASVAILPGPHNEENNDVDILEGRGEAGGGGLLMQALEQYQMRIARLLLGSVLAVFSGTFGSRGASETHMDMLKMVVKRYQGELVEDPINDQLLRPVLEYNVGKGKDLKFLLNPPNFDDIEKLGMMILNLTQGGYLSPEKDTERVLTAAGFEG